VPPLPAEHYRMPAEWEPHAATWIAWPHNRDDWPGKFGPIPWVYAEIVRHLRQSEQVRILVRSDRAAERVRRVLERAGVSDDNVVFYRIPTDRVWTRDYGPVFVEDARGRPVLLAWQFNGWAKYDNWKRDNDVPGRLNKKLNKDGSWILAYPRWRGWLMVLEGGSIDVNGRGTLLTTEECLLDKVQQRNPHLRRSDYERAFAQFLGVSKVLWLARGIAGDDTHGHVDDVARFVGPRTVVCAVEEDPRDVNYRPLRTNLERLRGMTDQDGAALEVVPLPMPHPVTFEGQRLPASYANFYVANDRVLVPTFNDPRDRQALGVLAELFPGRQVVGIHAVDLVWGFGTLHCLTQQLPQFDAGGPV
jgi:agmatine deiminase